MIFFFFYFSVLLPSHYNSNHVKITTQESKFRNDFAVLPIFREVSLVYD